VGGEREQAEAVVRSERAAEEPARAADEDGEG
jgi:hypothetical protein